MYADENINIRHSRGLTIKVDRNQPDEAKEVTFKGAIDRAQEIATSENISTIYVLE